MGKLFLIHIIAGVLWVVGGIWAAVSFILYLVKDRPFDWLSVWLLGAGLLLAIANFARFFFRR